MSIPAQLLYSPSTTFRYRAGLALRVAFSFRLAPSAALCFKNSGITQNDSADFTGLVRRQLPSYASSHCQFIVHRTLCPI
jgi:hypothetical protein